MRCDSSKSFTTEREARDWIIFGEEQISTSSAMREYPDHAQQEWGHAYARRVHRSRTPSVPEWSSKGPRDQRAKTVETEVAHYMSTAV